MLAFICGIAANVTATNQTGGGVIYSRIGYREGHDWIGCDFLKQLLV